YDLAILAGICGAYDPETGTGNLVRVEKERFANFGAESPAGFLTADRLGFLSGDELWTAGWMADHPGPASSFIEGVPAVKGITVEAASGTAETINEMRKRYSPGTESMEGAAFFYVCRRENLNFVQLRTVSNRVEPRDRSKWKIDLAIDNLATGLKNLIQQLHE
ncbi:MAG TPA: futalosine hydrolase, partial [Bacteroidales bacterium]|nr:futalosine hydrolase [Bacteroidales bacterium]